MSGAPDIRRLIADRWSELSPLFDELLDVDPAQRERWLDRHCADPALRAGLEQLIADSDREGLIDIGCERLARCLIPAGSDPDPAPPTWIGRRLGAYRIERLVGEGGMASVFLATRDDGGFEQRVAIKLLRQGMLDPYEQQRFLRERQILAGLEHPLIARLIDGGLTPEGVPWFAMEYVDGETLTDHCDRRGLEIDARLGLFLKVCEAVSHAHHALVVHRDLKPSNILVDGDGSLKLLDFGIARLIASELDAGSPDAMATTLAQRRLTPAYAAPEQWRDGAVTTATDVYALGVLLHELLTGLRPARRDDDTLRLPSSCLAVDERREELARQRGSLAGPLRRRLAGDLDMILCCALRLEPARRYASVDEFAADIRRHLSQRPVRARPERLGYRAGRFLRRHRVGAIAVLLVLLSVAAGVTGTLRQAGEARRAAERAQIEAQRAESVKNFLLGLFEAAAPDRSLGRELTVRELLDRGALTLSARMAETPALRAELQLILAGIYRELGQFDEAADLVEQARPAVRDQAAMSLELGRIAYAQTRYEAAEVALRAALADLDERDDPDRRALILTQLAEVLAVRDRREEAEAMVREAIELHRDGPTADALTLARDQTVLGTIAFGRGDLDAAERAIREALALRISALGPTHTQVATSQHDLAVVVLQRGDVDTAESMFELALTTRRQLLGADHPETAATLRNLGAVKRRQNDLATAERYYTEAADSLRRRFPDGHSELAHALNSLAVLEQERGRLEKAIAYLEEAVIGARNVYGPEHQTVGTMLNNVAALHRVTGGLDRAAQAQQEALTVLGNAVGERHHLYAVALSGQGFIELESGQVQAAYERFDAAAAVFSATLGEAHPDYAAALTGRSEAALGIGDQAVALADARTAFEVNAAALPPQHPRLRRSRLILAEALAAAGDCAAAGTEIERIGEPYTDVERPRVAVLQQVCR